MLKVLHAISVMENVQVHKRPRHRCSNLNDDLFRVNLADLNSCSFGSPCENSFHCFLECKKYTLKRQSLSLAL